MFDTFPPDIRKRLELVKIRHDGYQIHGKPLSPERTARLEELRAKYPKYGPAEPAFIPVRQTFEKGFSLYMHFEPVAHTEKEAGEIVYHWMCQHMAEISDLLQDKYVSEGLRGVTIAWE